MTASPDPIDVEVGRRLAARRIALGHNQSALARSVGKTFQQIQKYEKGTNRISASVLFHFARFLGVAPSYFFPEASADDPAITSCPTDAMVATRQGQELARIYTGLDDNRRAALLSVAKAIEAP